MARIIMKSWREGLKKVSLTKLQMSMLNKPLKESKNNVDLLLEGYKVEIEINNTALAQEFQIAANAIGVDCVMA
jgi:hypothetical protein